MQYRGRPGKCSILLDVLDVLVEGDLSRSFASAGSTHRLLVSTASCNAMRGCKARRDYFHDGLDSSHSRRERALGFREGKGIQDYNTIVTISIQRVVRPAVERVKSISSILKSGQRYLDPLLAIDA